MDGGVHREKTERKKLEVVRQEANLGEAALRLGVSDHSVSLSTSKTFDMVKMGPIPCIFNSSEYLSLGAWCDLKKFIALVVQLISGNGDGDSLHVE